MLDSVKSITKEVLGIDLEDVDMDTSLSDINIDSMDAVELFLAFEAEFDIEMPEDFAPETVGDLVRFIDEAVGDDSDDEDDDE